ncbi:MAG: TnpV protein [Eubacterium sp.]
MEKSLFEQMGGTYTQEGDYILPNLMLPIEEERPIGIWGQRHLRYIKQHRKIHYTELLTSGKLNAYLAELNDEADAMFSRLINQMVEKQGITEQLKDKNPMEWVQHMNNIQACAREIVNTELIYS